MKKLNFIVWLICSTAICACKSSIEPEIIPELEAFRDVKILTDSLNIDIGLGSRTSIKTSRGILNFFLQRVNIGCPIIEKNCDADTQVDLILNIQNDSLYLRHNLSFRYQPFYFPVTSCNSVIPDFRFQPLRIKPYYEVGINVPIKNLILGIRSIYPYPKDYSESALFVNNRKFHVILTVQNSCKP